MKQIRIKTDASHRPGSGFGIGYVANMFRVNSIKNQITGGKYCTFNCSSTDAERFAVVWSLNDVISRLDIHKREYEIILNTDCENVIRKFNDESCEDEGMKILRHYKRLFKSFQIHWIPRAENRKADAIARSNLDKGMEK